MTTISKCYVTLCVSLLILNHHAAKLRVYRFDGTRNNDVCTDISSNSNSNAKVPMPRFTKGPKIPLTLKETTSSFKCCTSKHRGCLSEEIQYLGSEKLLIKDRPESLHERNLQFLPTRNI